MAKELSAYTFNDYWNNNKPEINEPEQFQPEMLGPNTTKDLPAEESQHLFDFLNTKEKHEDGLIDALGGLLPETQGED